MFVEIFNRLPNKLDRKMIHHRDTEDTEGTEENFVLLTTPQMQNVEWAKKMPTLQF